MSVTNPLTQRHIDDLVASILQVQRDDGFIPWSEVSHGDPWNHTEAVVALLLAGKIQEAELGIEWLIGAQNHDGSFCQYYLSSGVEEPRRDLNCTLYPIVGAYLYLQATNYQSYAPEILAMTKQAVGYVSHYQRQSGEFPWAVDPDGSVHAMALRTANASICTSLVAAERVFGAFHLDTSHLRQMRQRAQRALVGDWARYANKWDWAMDWYYPVFGEIFDVDLERVACHHLLLRHYEFKRGLRCLGSRPWVTAAETAEFAAALSLGGRFELAAQVLSSTRWFIDGSRGVITGKTLPDGHEFPGGERTTYSAAAMVIAASVLQSEVTGSLLDACNAAMVSHYDEVANF